MRVRPLIISGICGCAVFITFMHFVEDDTRQIPKGRITQLLLIVNPRAFVAENAMVAPNDPIWIDKDIVVPLRVEDNLPTSFLFDRVVSGASAYRKYYGATMIRMQTKQGTFQFVIPPAEFEQCFNASASGGGPINLIFVPPAHSGPCPRIESIQLRRLISEAISSNAELNSQSLIFSSKLRELMKRK